MYYMGELATELGITDEARALMMHNATRSQADYGTPDRQLGSGTILGRMAFKFTQYNLFQYQELKRAFKDARHQGQELGWKTVMKNPLSTIITVDDKKHFNMSSYLLKRFLTQVAVSTANIVMKTFGTGLTLSMFFPTFDRWLSEIFELMWEWYYNDRYPSVKAYEDKREEIYDKKNALIGQNKDEVPYWLINKTREVNFLAGWGLKIPSELVISLMNKKDNEDYWDVTVNPFAHSSHAALTGNAAASRFRVVYDKYRAMDQEGTRPQTMEERNQYIRNIIEDPSWYKVVSRLTGINPRIMGKRKEIEYLEQKEDKLRGR
jgi:hypothetical protein